MAAVCFSNRSDTTPPDLHKPMIRVGFWQRIQAVVYRRTPSSIAV